MNINSLNTIIGGTQTQATSQNANQAQQAQHAQSTSNQTYTSSKLESTTFDGKSNVSTLLDGDILELSDQGMAMANSRASIRENSETIENSETSEAISGISAETTSETLENAKVTIDQITSDSDDDEDDSEDTTDLSSYSESELRTMMADGTISASEYNAEVKRREDDTDQQTPQAQATTSSFSTPKATIVEK